MRLRNTLVLASVFLLLAAYVYFFELQKDTKEKTEKLLNFKQEEVEGIILNYAQLEIRLHREPLGRWKMARPLEAAADEAAVGAILSALNSIEVKRTVEEKPGAADLKNYGLDSPEIKVLISLRNGVALPPVSVGGKTPVGNSVYVRRGAETAVLLTDASLRSNLEKKLNDLRDKRILDFGPDAVKQLALKGGKGDFALSKQGDTWFLDRPGHDRADQQEVQRLLTAIRNLSTQDFIDHSPVELKKFGLDKPRLKISVVTGEGEAAREIFFGNKREDGDEIYAVVDAKPPVYIVDESAYNRLNKQPTDFLEKEKK